MFSCCVLKTGTGLQLTFAAPCDSSLCRYYYLGSYVHSCHKVNYKAEYGPAELLCPITLQWVTLQSAKQVLDQQTAEIKFTRSPFCPPNAVYCLSVAFRTTTIVCNHMAGVLGHQIRFLVGPVCFPPSVFLRPPESPHSSQCEPILVDSWQ